MGVGQKSWSCYLCTPCSQIEGLTGARLTVGSAEGWLSDFRGDFSRGERFPLDLWEPLERGESLFFGELLERGEPLFCFGLSSKNSLHSLTSASSALSMKNDCKATVDTGMSFLSLPFGDLPPLGEPFGDLPSLGEDLPSLGEDLPSLGDPLGDFFFSLGDPPSLGDLFGDLLPFLGDVRSSI